MADRLSELALGVLGQTDPRQGKQADQAVLSGRLR
jgi:hypothetical protein